MQKIKSFKPLLNRVLVKRIIPEAKTQSGIILSQKSAEKEARFGEVVSVGPGDKTEDGKLIDLSVKVGDYVLLPEYYGTNVPMEGDSEFFLYKDTELLGVLEGVKLH
jgi:chaperonin GroES